MTDAHVPCHVLSVQWLSNDLSYDFVLHLYNYLVLVYVNTYQ